MDQASTSEAGGPGTRRGRARRWLVRLAIGLAVLIGLAFGAVVFVTRTGPGRSIVRKQLISKLGGVVNGSIDVGRIDGNLLGHFQLHDVSIEDRAGNVVIAAKSAEVKFHPKALLRRRVDVDEISLSGVTVNLARGPDGRVNVASLFRTSGEEEETGPSPWVIDVDGVAIDDADVDLTELVPRLGAVHVERLRGKVDVAGGKVDAELDQLVADVPALSQHASVAGRVTIDDGRLRGGLTLSGTGITVRVPVALFGGDTRALVAAARVHVEPAAAGLLVPQLDVRTPADVSVTAASMDLSVISFTAAVHAGEARIATVGTFDVDSGSLSLGLGAGPFNPSTVMTSAPDVQLDGLRAAGQWGQGGRVDLKVAGRGGGMGVATQRFSAQVTGTTRELSGTVRSQGGGSRLNVEGGVSLEGGVELRSTRVDFQSVDLGTLLGRSVPVRGALSTHLTASGPLERLRVRGSLSGSHVTLPGLSAADLTARVDLRGVPADPSGRLDVELHDASTGGQHLSSATASVSVGENGALQARVHATGPQGHLTTRLGGTLASDHLVVSLRELRGRFMGLPVASATGNVRIGFDGSVRARNLELHAIGGTISAQGGVETTPRGPQIRAALELGDVELQPLGVLALGDGSLTGTASGTVQVALGPRENSAHIDVEAQGAYQSTTTGAIDARVDLEHRKLALSIHAGTGNGDTRLTVDGLFDAPRDPTDVAAWRAMERRAVDHLDVTARVPQLAKIAGWLPLGPVTQGAVVAEVHATRELKTTRLHVEGTQLQTLMTEAPATASLDAALEDGRFSAELVASSSELGLVRVTGDVKAPADPLDVAAWGRDPLDAQPHVVAELRGVRPNTAMWAALGLSKAPKGRLDGRIELAGTEHELRATLHARQVQVGPMRRPIDVATQVTLDRREATAQVDVGLGAGPLVTVNGTLGLSFDDVLRRRFGDITQVPMSARLSSVNIDVPQISQVTGAVHVGGTLHLEGEATGTIARPRGYVLATLDDARYQSLVVDHALARVSVLNEKLEASVDIAHAGGGTLNAVLRSQLGVREPQRELRIDARNFEIGLLASLGPPSIRGLGGELDSNLVLRVRGDEPQEARGNLHLQNGKVSLNGPLRKLSDIDLSLGAQTGVLRLTARADAGDDGAIDLKSRIQMRGIVPESITGTLNVSDLPLATSAGTVELSFRSKLANDDFDLTEPSLTATVTDGLVKMPEGNGRSLHDIGPPTDVVFVPSLQQGIVESEGRATSPLPPITLSVKIPQSLVVRGEQISGVVDANMDLTFYQGKVEWLGHIELQRAWVSLFKHRYTVEHASADFPAIKEFNPYVDVQMSVEFKTAVFTVSLKGNLDEPPKPVFSAEPAIYDDSQLLGFFLGGSPDEANRGQSNSARAAGAATSLVTSKITDIVQQIVPLIDVLKLESTEKSATPDQLLAGKWLTDKVLLAYRARLSQADDPRTNINEVTLEWWFLRRWLLQMYYGDRNAGAVDILWIKRF